MQIAIRFEPCPYLSKRGTNQRQGWNLLGEQSASQPQTFMLTNQGIVFLTSIVNLLNYEIFLRCAITFSIESTAELFSSRLIVVVSTTVLWVRRITTTRLLLKRKKRRNMSNMQSLVIVAFLMFLPLGKYTNFVHFLLDKCLFCASRCKSLSGVASSPDKTSWHALFAFR